MKTEFKVRPHTELPGQFVIEVWFGGRFVATVTGSDGPNPGVRLISKHLVEGNDPTLVLHSPPGWMPVPGYAELTFRLVAQDAKPNQS